MTSPLSQDSEDMENAEDEVDSRASRVGISRQYLRCEGGGRSEEPVRGGRPGPHSTGMSGCLGRLDSTSLEQC